MKPPARDQFMALLREAALGGSLVKLTLGKPAGDPEDLFRVDNVIAGDKTAPPENETGCKVQWQT